MQTLITTKLAELRVGDRILSWDGRPYGTPQVVAQPLGPIGPGTVYGVRLESPTPGSGIEHVLYFDTWMAADWRLSAPDPRPQLPLSVPFPLMGPNRRNKS
jgi:hypothetical protein